MRFISIDLELNQPTNKIIQIGAVAYDTDKGRVSSFSRYVDPGETINWKHVLNTGQTLDALLPSYFPTEWFLRKQSSCDALTEFWQWVKDVQCGKKFIQWGSGDLKCLLAESQGLGYPTHIRTLDLKMVYQFIWQPSARLQKNSGLSSACREIGTATPLHAHDAFYDAEATGILFLKIFKQVSGLQQLLKDLE